MLKTFYRLKGKTENSPAMLVYESFLISSVDVQRLNDSSLEMFAAEFAQQVWVGARYIEELLSVIPDKSDLGVYDSKTTEFFLKTSKSRVTPDQFLELVEPVYSALRNHQL